jgi:glucose-6-phosphate isomerase
VGRFLQLTGHVDEDVAVRGRAYSMGTLQAAQAASDRLALARRTPGGVLRLHLTDRAAGVAQLLDLLQHEPR